MSLLAFFAQECPTCGRSLEIRVELLGRNVYCQHCRAKFVAGAPSRGPADVSDTETLLRRAERLIEDSQVAIKVGFQRTAT
jgi:ribosomal protein L37AE/L43A